MSQITRCPSCATAFKVVADQLRISEGWVRCGQCKEVFDAAAHLVPAAPQALLPDVSLPAVPAVAPASASASARRSVPERAWGGSAALPGGATGPAARQGPASRPQPATPPPPAPEPPLAEQTGRDGDGAGSAPELAVPPPSVPAFLAADAARDASLAPWGTAAPSFPWRGEGSGGEPGLSGTSSGAVPVPAPSAAAAQMAGASAVGTVAAEPAGAGYELPSAALPDSAGLGEEMPAPQDGAPLVETLAGYPPLELPARKAAVAPPSTDPEPEDSPPVQAPGPAAEVLALVEDDSPAMALQAPRRSRPQGAGEEEGDDAEEGAAPAVGFVIAAQRKAFWRKPGVRMLLVLLALVALLALAAQVAVHERDRLAAMDARARPWLQRLCAPLDCTLAPQRQIADVVIDSSSFNKARGDSYLLAFSVKSKAAIPLAMPAVELTLTDAQDQPVVRRVLLPADMGAPAELPPHGDWGASVSVVVTTAGARVTGYRLLAFYP